MSDLLLMAQQGLPRNGLCALWDPYRDVYGRNVLPVGAEGFSTGWTAYSGAAITVTPNQPDPYGGNNAYRIQSSGGGGAVKYYLAITGRINPHTDTVGCWTKLLSGNAKIYNGGDAATVLGSTEAWSQYNNTRTFASTGSGIYFGCASAGDSLDILAFHPQLNLGSTLWPYALPVGAPGTLQTSLDYSGHGNNLTLGASTSAGADDPSFTGTSLLFGGDDFVQVGDLSAQGKFYGGMFVFTNSVAINKSTTAAGLLNTLTAAGDFWGLGFGSVSALLTDEIVWVKDAAGYRAGWCDASAEIAAGTHLLTVYWTGSNYAFEVDGVAKTTSSAGTPQLLVMSAVYLGVNVATGPSYLNYFTGGLNLATLYTRSPSASERARSNRYLKSLMSGRGLTPAW